MSEVMGYWVKKKMRCDYCHHPREQMYVVKMGDCQGNFCGADHYHAAKKAKDAGKLPEHENA